MSKDKVARNYFEPFVVCLILAIVFAVAWLWNSTTLNDELVELQAQYNLLERDYEGLEQEYEYLLEDSYTNMGNALYWQNVANEYADELNRLKGGE